MQIFLDSADLEEIKKAKELGYLNGLTTNPSLVSKTGKTYEQIAAEIANSIEGEVSLEVIATEYEPMLDEARKLAGTADNVVVKLPMTPAGLNACRKLSEEGIKVNMTLIFSSTQALLAAKAGAYYASIFVGRLDDAGSDGEEVIAETREVFDWYGYETQLLFASVRTVEHVQNAALLGCDIVTVPFKLFEKLHQHPMTDQGLKKFLEDYAKVGG